MVNLIDTHAHIYAEEFNEDRNLIVERAQKQNIGKILMPNIELESYEGMMELNRRFPLVCLPMLGLHPCSVKENYTEELDALLSFFEPGKFVGIGEIGLDLYWDKNFFIQQKEALIKQCEFALLHNLPVALHTRNATNETIEIVEPLAAKGLRGVFHCFTDDAITAQKIIGMGFYLGIGGVLTFKNSGLAQTLDKISLEHIVLETDSPYLAPVPNRGKRNEPAYISMVAQSLAEVKRVSYAEVASVTTANANKLFSLV